MRKNYNTATEVLMYEKRRTVFWFAAFVVAFTVVILDHVSRKVA